MSPTRENLDIALRTRPAAPSHIRRKPQPHDADVIIIGAGAAGIAAARDLRRHGVDSLILEARDRPGGRAQTIALAGQAVDIGAHWLHAADANALVRQAKRLGLRLSEAAQEPLLMTRAGTRADPESYAAFMRRWESVYDAMIAHPANGPAIAADAVFSQMGDTPSRFDDTIRFLHGPFDSGVGLETIDAGDFAAAEDDSDLFVEGGYGALILRLARGLAIHYETPVTRIDWSGAGVRVETPRGTLSARAVLVTTPLPLLQSEAIRFAPHLPLETLQAIYALRPALYEHVVLSWPDHPFADAVNRLVAFEGDARDNLGMLANIDGAHLHYADIGAQTVAALPDPRDRAGYVREFLTARFGSRALARCDVLAASDWAGDPWTGCAWMYAPVGAYGARAALRAAVGERIHFAGEASSATQWGTIGGAWAEGERAAGQIRAGLRDPVRGAVVQAA
ncbi:MAG: flavin monoamine oxidase family protein [Salinarimonas sp.]